MSVLLLGLAPQRAGLVLEQLSTDEADQAKIIDTVLQSPLVTEAMVLSPATASRCTRLSERSDGGLSVIGQVLSDHSGMSMGDLTK